MDISKLSATERTALMADLMAQEKADKDRVKSQRDAYKDVVDEAIRAVFPRVEENSRALGECKKFVYETFQTALLMKADVYDVCDDQRSNTFTSKDSTMRIILGQYATDDYDDTVNEGIAKVKNFISSLAKDADSQLMVRAILKLLSRDQKGSLKASRVMQLRQMAAESGNEEFIDGVNIIDAAYRPAISKYYVKAEKKNDLGAWINIPLGMTEA